MGLFDYIFGEDEPVKTATPNVKTPVNKSQPVETLTPNITPPLATPIKPVEVNTWKKTDFLEKLKWQESGPFIDDKERASKSGDTGRAIGPYQIWPIYVKQANNYLPAGAKPFTMEDRLDAKKSEQIIDAFMGNAVNEFKSKYGRSPNEIEIARLHHSGGVKTKNWGNSADIEYGKEFDKKGKQIGDWKSTDYGLRNDGTRKGYGFFGPISLRDKNGKVFNNKFATEISVGVNINGKEIEIPTIVGSLTPEERKWITTEGNDPRRNPAIMQKAIESAKSRMAKGLSPFRDTPPKKEEPKKK